MQNKFWCLVFLTVPIFGVGVFAIGPYLNIWLPQDVSVHGRGIDRLFMFILWLTGAVFVVTEFLLFFFMWRYDGQATREEVKFTHGSHSLELIWTIIPAATLLFIAIYQMDAWAAAKMRKPDMRPTAEVVGRQFEWRFRYPGPDGELNTMDDIHDAMELHVPVGEEVLLAIRSEDVLHSFFLPNLRVKQDLVPGMLQYVWFEATDRGQYDIVCAELCGWGHYKMKGQLIIESREEFQEWLDQAYAEQQRKQEPESGEE